MVYSYIKLQDLISMITIKLIMLTTWILARDRLPLIQELRLFATSLSEGFKIILIEAINLGMESWSRSRI